MVFWAWSEHKNAQERFKNQGRTEATKEYEKKLAIAAKEHQDKLATAAKEHENKLAAARERAKAEGIDLDKYLNS